jgi:hypothetical protein
MKVVVLPEVLYRLLFQIGLIKIGLNEICNGIVPKPLDYNIIINGVIFQRSKISGFHFFIHDCP